MKTAIKSNPTKAIFVKQLKATIKTLESLIQFIIFPLLAWMMGFMMNQDAMVEGFYELDLGQDMIDMLSAQVVSSMPNMVTMQATIFIGMGLIPVVAGIISDDMERKSIRFLSMAGVKPGQYIRGIGGVVFLLSFFSSLAFTFIGGFFGMDTLIFMGAMMSGAVASIILGATIGMFCGNVQSASGLAMPFALVLGFGPLFAQFSDTIARIWHVSYTQQLNVIADYLDFGYSGTPLWESFAIIWANIAVLGVLFALVYKKKGIVG